MKHFFFKPCNHSFSCTNVLYAKMLSLYLCSLVLRATLSKFIFYTQNIQANDGSVYFVGYAPFKSRAKHCLNI